MSLRRNRAVKIPSPREALLTGTLAAAVCFSLGLAITMDLGTAGSGSTRDPASAHESRRTRRSARLAPSTDGSALFGNVLTIPPDCVLDERGPGEITSFSYGSWNEFQEHPLIHGVRSARGEAYPDVIWIREECRDYFHELSRRTVARHFGSGSSVPAFRLRRGDSHRPSYCGIPRQQTGRACQGQARVDAESVIAIGERLVPEAFHGVVDSVRNRATTTFAPGSGSRFELLATPTRSFEPSLRAFKSGYETTGGWFGRGAELRLRRQGYISFIKAKPHEALGRATDGRLAAFTIVHMARGWADRWAREHRTGWFSVDRSGHEAAALIGRRAEALMRYWADDEPVAAAESRRGDADDNRDRGALTRFHWNSTEIASSPALAALSREILSQAEERISYSHSADEMIEAASYWWAVRSVAIDGACDLDTGLPRVAGTPEALADQYRLDECGRRHTDWIVGELNRIAHSGEPLRLASPAWRLAYALAGRHERAEITRFTAEALERQLRQGQLPEPRDLKLLSREILQVTEELRTGMALDWTGLRPATDLEARAMRAFIRAARGYTEALGAAAHAARLTHPAFHESATRFWESAHAALELKAWGDSFHSDLAVFGRDELSQALDHLRVERPGFLRDVAALHRRSLEVASADPASDAPACRQWLRYLESARRDHPARQWALEPTGDSAPVTCLGLLPLWTREGDRLATSDSGRLVSQCSQGHGLSCLTWAYLEAGSAASEPRADDLPNTWTQVLTSAPVQAHSAERMFSLFETAFARGVRHESDRRAWTSALNMIHRALRDRLLEATETPPAPEAFRACVESTHWFEALRLSGKDGLNSAFTGLPLSADCPSERTAHMRAWARRLAALRTLNLRDPRPKSGRWEENPVSAARRYRLWMITMSRHLQRHLRPRPTPLKRTKAAELERALEPYLRSPPITRHSVMPDGHWWLSEGDSGDLFRLRMAIRSEIRAIAGCELNRFRRCRRDFVDFLHEGL